jgi:predicted Fe-S protein YdhL (DUF1289 family)
MKQSALSPCNGICTMNPTTHLCEGCARTLAEIAGWSQLSAAQQRSMRAILRERRARAAAATAAAERS